MADSTTKRKRLSPEERRAAIIEAAVSLFARQGFTRTTTKEIAAAANISEGTIYKYFPSKEAILFSFIQPTATRTVPDFFSPENAADDRTLILNFMEDRFRLWDEHSDLIKVVIGEAIFNPALADGLDQMLDPILDLIEAYIRRRIADGTFRQMNAMVAARTLVNMTVGYYIKWRVISARDPLSISRRELIEEITDLFLHGVMNA